MPPSNSLELRFREDGTLRPVGADLPSFDPAGDDPDDPILAMAIAPVVMRDARGVRGLGTSFCIAALPSGKALYVTAQHVVAEFLPAELTEGVHHGILPGCEPFLLLPGVADARAHEAIPISAVAACVNNNDIAICTVDLSASGIPMQRAVTLQVTMGRPREGEKCVGFGYGDMKAGDLVPDQPDKREWYGPLRGSRAVVEEVFPSGRDRVLLPFPCFRTSAYYASGMSGGPIFRDDGRVVGVVSDSYGPENRTAHGAIFAAILAAEFRLPDENGEPRVFSFQELTDLDHIDVDDAEVNVRRTEDESSLEWPD
jgi:hypothetical protein